MDGLIAYLFKSGLATRQTGKRHWTRCVIAPSKNTERGGTTSICERSTNNRMWRREQQTRTLSREGRGGLLPTSPPARARESRLLRAVSLIRRSQCLAHLDSEARRRGGFPLRRRGAPMVLLQPQASSAAVAVRVASLQADRSKAHSRNDSSLPTLFPQPLARRIQSSCGACRQWRRERGDLRRESRTTRSGPRTKRTLHRLSKASQ